METVKSKSFLRAPLSDESMAKIDAGFAELRRARAERESDLPTIRRQGEEALRRLLHIAQGDSGQCRHVAMFLLSLYNGSRFKFDLTDFRCIDHTIFEDCVAVLRMDYQPVREVHTYFDHGGDIWEKMAQDWRVPDRVRLRGLIAEAQFQGADAERLYRDAGSYIDSRAI